MKKNIVVLFGSKSCEHDISVITAVQLMNNISSEKYNIVPVYVTRQGEMIFNNKFRKMDTFKNNIHKKYPILFKNGWLYKKNIFGAYAKFKKVYCAVLCFHGKNGEDGTMQGLLESENIPYTSSGVLSSALTLNKKHSKHILKSNSFNITNFISVNKDEQFENIQQHLETNSLNFPLVVKPNRLGSSIGISKVENIKELYSALQVAFNFDSEVVIEECVTALKEFNCACFKYKNKLIVSEVEQPINKNEILTFVDKYLSNKKGTKGMKSLNRICPSQIGKKLKEKILETTKRVYNTFDCEGVVRVDYMFCEKTKQLYVNELNSIPGSMAFYLFEKVGINYSQLIDMLINQAIIKFENKQKENTVFESSVLK